MAATPSTLSFCLCTLFLFLSITSAHHICRVALEANGDEQGRSLIEPQEPSNQGCPVDFSKVNYKPLLDKCKGPPYPAKPCCDGLREVSCPHSNQLNDVKNNDCAYSMFFHINQKGKYPVGLFFNMCTQFGDKDKNLPCDN